ncbi:MAG: hypothetical protein PVS3B2_00270 [Candidatus Dormibacteraceae bacterium]
MPDPTALTMADVLGKSGPALSATSDMPVASPAPAPTADPPAAPAAPAPAPDASGTPPAPPPSDKDETPAWMKAEITKERNRRRDTENARADAERKAAEAQARLDEALARIPKPADAPPPPADPRPSREAFEDPQAYDDALIEWSTRQASAKVREEAAEIAKKDAEAKAETARKEAETAQVTEMQTKWGEARTKAIERMPDYEAVAENPELSARLAALPPPQAVFEMGLLAAQLQAAGTTKPQLTSAPDPVSKPLGSRSSAVSKGPNEESMDEYAARRTKELRASATTRH